MAFYTNEAWRPIQQEIGVSVDGKAGDNTRKALAARLGCPNDWYSIQAAVGASIDGVPGPNTIKAIRVALGLDCATENGQKHVVIDIGHADGTGSSGHGLEEHAVNVVIADHLKNMLRDAGYKVTVIDYPEKSNTDDLNQTVKYLNGISYDLAVSLHSDCVESKSACGGHVCYKAGDDVSKKLAWDIAMPLAALLPGRANKVEGRTNLAVLNKPTQRPVVLCEGGFISNTRDAAVMRDHPEKIAEAYFTGIQSHFGK